MIDKFQIRPIDKNDRDWIVSFLKKTWGNPKIVTRGKIHQADKLPGLIALQKDKPLGLLIYRIEGKKCEIITMNSLKKRMGIGAALLNAVKKTAVLSKCRYLWLITTNDNLEALKFYQKKGFSLVAIHRNAIEKSRKLKPEIPLKGVNGIPIKDEIELEYVLKEKN